MKKIGGGVPQLVSSRDISEVLTNKATQIKKLMW